jgi:fatty-acyl-CoA synthase
MENKGERKRKLTEWIKKNLGQALERVADRYPENIALIFKGQPISHKILWEKAQALAKGFMALGLYRGDKVSLWAGNCSEWINTQMETALIGAVLVPVNTRFRGPGLLIK